ncbi:flagellar hook-length control protein FliK [Geobacillus sp. YF-1]|uniref:flagellar hook-length control protein FliK n=1 Tax=Geobacillus sp. YF-1 TaxID=3457480 RepID=UPI0040457FD7
MVERMERTLPVAAVRDPVSRRPLAPGEAIIGRVEQVEETETGERSALVRAGGQLIRARLEAPLAEGRLYLFEIHEQGRWKAVPLSRAGAHSLEEAARQWQRAWKLSDVALPVLRQALKAGAVVTKTEVVKLAEAAQQTGQPDSAEEVLAHLFRRGLPPSPAVFRALWAARAGAPLASLLTELKAALAALPAQPGTVALRQDFERLLSPSLFAYETAAHVALAARQEGAEPALALWARLGLAPLTKDGRMALREALRQRRFSEVGRLLGVTDEERFFARVAAVDAAFRRGELPRAEAELWAAARTARDPALSVFHWLRRMAARLGVGDEAELARALKTGSAPVAPSSLKGLLLRLLHDPETSGAKRTAEALLDRLDGMAIASGRDGAMEHAWLAFPLPLGRHDSDLVVYWQGRRSHERTLDTDYSRIVCSLTLEELGEVVVDMRVQRRIVHISIFHDDPRLSALIARLSPLAKERFQAHGYRLSGVDVKAASAACPPSLFPFQSGGSGVDWRA